MCEPAAFPLVNASKHWHAPKDTSQRRRMVTEVNHPQSQQEDDVTSTGLLQEIQETPNLYSQGRQEDGFLVHLVGEQEKRQS